MLHQRAWVVAWIAGAPDVQSLASADVPQATRVHIIKYIDSIVCTTIDDDEHNFAKAPRPQTSPHICNKPYSEVQDLDMDLAALIATSQRRCSTAYQKMVTKNAGLATHNPFTEKQPLQLMKITTSNS